MTYPPPWYTQASAELLPAPSAELWRTCFHEAGHAVCAHVSGFPVLRATIVASGRYTGRCHYLTYPPPARDWPDVVVSLGGLEAARHFGAYTVYATSDQDYKDACSELGERYGPLTESERADLILTGRRYARALVARHEQKVFRVAYTLMLAGTLEQDALSVALA